MAYAGTLPAYGAGGLGLVEGPRFPSNYGGGVSPLALSYAAQGGAPQPLVAPHWDAPMARPGAGHDLAATAELARRLAQQANSAPLPADRSLQYGAGGLDLLQPSQLAPTRPASPSVAAAHQRLDVAADLHPGDLPKEVSAREVELRVLRAEAAAREAEAAKLRDQVRDAELALQQASGTVGTLSAKVEATSGNRHAVLEASAQHIDTQVSGLRRRLARTEAECARKGEEMVSLRQAVELGTRRVEEQRAALEALQRSHDEHGARAMFHEEDINRLQRHKAIGEWRDRVHAQIGREELDAKLVRERRDRERQIQALDEDMVTFRAFLTRMEDKCRHHAAEMKKLQQRFDELVMEERLCLSAARLGHDTANERKQHHMDEQRELQARIQDEIARKAAKSHHARAYDEVEADALRYQSRLAALIACSREISRTLQQGGHPGSHPPRGATAAISQPAYYTAPPSTASLMTPMAIGTAQLMRA